MLLNTLASIDYVTLGSGIGAGLAAAGWYVYNKFKKTPKKKESKKVVEPQQDLTLTTFWGGYGDAVQQNRVIQEAVSELRVLLHADRTRIGMFHNGGYYFDGSQSKKFSITFESTGANTRPTGVYTQSVPLSMYKELVDIIQASKEPTVVYVDKLPKSIFRSQKMSEDVEVFCMVPIYKWNQLIGFLSCQWFESEIISDLTPEQLKLVIERVQDTNNNISAILSRNYVKQ